MSNSPAISIIIPVFHVRDYIQDCVSSVISQDTKLDIEIILVDDCGGDDSIDIARQVLNKAPSNFSSKIIRNKCNKGVSFSRNAGSDAAGGEYILYLDSDDCLLPDALSRLWKGVAVHHAEMVVGGVLCTDKRRYPTYFDLPKDSFVTENFFLHFCERKIYGSCWNHLISRRFLQKHHICFAEGIYHEDELWNMQIAFYNPLTYVTPDQTYLYRTVVDDSRSAIYTLDHVRSILFIIDQLLAELPPLSSESREHFDKWCIHIFTTRLMTATLNSKERSILADKLVQAFPKNYKKRLTRSSNLRIKRLGILLLLRPASLAKFLTSLYLKRFCSLSAAIY